HAKTAIMAAAVSMRLGAACSDEGRPGAASPLCDGDPALVGLQTSLGCLLGRRISCAPGAPRSPVLSRTEGSTGDCDATASARSRSHNGEPSRRLMLGTHI